MSETPTQRLLAVVLDDQPLDDQLVRELALSADAHGELVRLAAVLARLPGDGARAAELRLDHLLDDVAMVAASESRASSAAGAAHAFDVAHGEPHDEPHAAHRKRSVNWLTLGGELLAAAAVVLAMLWPSGDAQVATAPAPMVALQPVPPPVPAPAPAVAPPTEAVGKMLEPSSSGGMLFVDIEIRVTPATATISIDGVPVAGNPFTGRRVGDDLLHRITASAPGHLTKRWSVAFNANVTLDFSLERAALVAVKPPPRVPVREPAFSINPSTRSPRELQALISKERATTPTVPHDAPSSAPPASPALPAVRDVPAASSAKARVGRLMVATNVRDIEILVDDVAVGRTPLEQPLVVAEGRHTVTLAAEGYSPETRAVDVPAAGTVRIEPSLRPAGPRMLIDASGGSKPLRPIDPTNPYVRATP